MNLIEKISSTEKMVTEFQKAKSSLKGFPVLREKSISEFERLGIPNRKNEEWKYSDASALFKNELQVGKLGSMNVQKKDIEKFLIPNLNASVVVLVNGIYSEEQSALKNIPKGEIGRASCRE